MARLGRLSGIARKRQTRDGLLLCARCRTPKPPSDYSPRSEGGVVSWCRPCFRGYQTERRRRQGVRPRGERLRGVKRKRHFVLLESTLRRLYVEKRLSMSVCAERYGCSAHTVRRRLAEFGIPIRRREAQAR